MLSLFNGVDEEGTNTKNDDQADDKAEDIHRLALNNDRSGMDHRLDHVVVVSHH